MRNPKLIFALFCICFVFACSKPEDKCKNFICFNDGVCLEGTCQCPPQWTGFSCAVVATPKKIRIKSITISDYPNTNPDLYLYHYDINFNQYIRVSDTIENAGPDSATFVYNPPIDHRFDVFFIGDEKNPNTIIDAFQLSNVFEEGLTTVKTTYGFTGIDGIIKGSCMVEYEW